MVKVRVLIGTLAYGPSPAQTKIAQKGDVIEMTEEQLGKVAIAPAIPATVELVQKERRPIANREKEKTAEPPK